MTKSMALSLLRRVAAVKDDPERTHIIADNILLALINDSEIKEAYEAVPAWYS